MLVALRVAAMLALIRAEERREAGRVASDWTTPGEEFSRADCSWSCV